MRTRTIAVAMAIALAAALGACGDDDDEGNAATSAPKSAEPVKLGLLMKFPVDFFLTMESAAKDWDAATDAATVTTGIGKSATDDAGQIDLIGSMVTQGVDGIAITPTSPAVIPALDAAAGLEDASVAQFPTKMGELGMETLLKAVKGESVEPNVDTRTEIVTKANASEFR